MGIDKDAQVVTLQDGKKIQYDALISTLPLDIMMTWLGQKKQADVLTHRYANPIMVLEGDRRLFASTPMSWSDLIQSEEARLIEVLTGSLL